MHVNHKKLKMKLLLALVASFLLVAPIVSIVAGHVPSHEQHISIKNSIHRDSAVVVAAAHSVLNSTCSTTLYPDLCVSAIALVPEVASKVKSPKDVIQISVNLTIVIVEHNYFTVKKLIATRKKYLTKREKTALHDCLEMIDETLDELHKVEVDIQDYPYDNSSVSEHADNLKTLLSAAMTNQDTCIDGFSHDKADKIVRKALMKGQVHVLHMCSNVLAMIKNLTDKAPMANLPGTDHMSSLGKDGKGGEWPEWLSAGDRRLLQATTVTPDVTVAADGSGNYLTVAAAVAAAPEGSTSRYVIRIKAGVYRENVEVTKTKTNIMFVGDGRTNTIITGSRNVVDGSTTFHSATVAVVGERFLARDITFQNTAGPSKHQAVALRVGSDLSAFYRCDMLAYQDTLYVHSLRQFYTSCIIVGTVDFIFGNAAAVFQNCDIHARRPNPGQKNMVTAQGRDDPNQNTGIVIQKCRIGATSDLLAVQSSFPTYLGRPWKIYSRTVIMQSVITDVINPAGWFEWSGNLGLDTLYYGEYQNSGAGAATANRVTWKGFKVITSATEAQAFTSANFIGGSSWLGSTGFPFSLGL